MKVLNLSLAGVLSGGVLVGGWPSGYLWLASFVLFGMPHGAHDALTLWQKASRGDRHRLLLFGLLVLGYFAVGAVMWWIWNRQPLMAGGLFLLITLLHWGRTERFRRPAPSALGGYARAGWIVLLPIALDLEASTGMLVQVARTAGATVALWPPLGAWLLVLALGLLAVDGYGLGRARSSPKHYAELAGLLLGAVLLPASAFIAIYFICIHSLEWLRQQGHSSQRQLMAANGKGLLISLVFLTPWLVLLPSETAFWRNPWDASAAYLLLISLLTAPHWLLECLSRDPPKAARTPSELV